MPTPQINVLLPTYEPYEPYLKQAIESLLAQTEKEWTLMIHDDCSQKDVASMVRPYLEDSRIQFVRSEKRLGIGGNWNACLRHGKAPFIQYLFQDDTWDKAYLRTARIVMEDNPSVGFLAVDHDYAADGGMELPALYKDLRTLRQRELDPGIHEGKQFLQWWLRRGLHPNIIGEPPFVMLRRSTVEKVGTFHESMPQFLDSEYWARLLLVSDFFYHAHSFGTFRVHPEAASARNDKEGKGLFDRFTCLEAFSRTFPEPERSVAKKALHEQFELMVTKYFERRKTGKRGGLKGSGMLKKFCMRHPLLTIKSMWKAMRLSRSSV